MFANINMLAVVVCAVAALALGFVWYGPLFGKKWMRVMGSDQMSPEAMEKMKKAAMKLYVVQFLLSLFQAFVLAHFVSGFGIATGILGSVWIWAGFVMPTIAAACMWTSDSSRVSWTKFLIQAGYQIILFAIFGTILGVWY